MRTSRETVTSLSPESDLPAVLAWLEKNGTQAGREGMARYAIPSEHAFGVSVGELLKQAKRIGPNHALALALWKTGKYEARLLASYLGDPARVTPALMEQWSRDFDNWAIVDTVCFKLFDRTPHAWAKVARWATRQDEYGKRAAFALIWSLTVHDKQASNAPFLHALTFIEQAATDDRHWVKKAVNMALRAIGKRHPLLNRAALDLATRLAESRNETASWIGRDALRDLQRKAGSKKNLHPPARR